MAILTTDELVWLRRKVARKAEEKNQDIHWVKTQVNAALQAIEDRWEAAGTQTALSNDIEAAAPGVFSVAEKRFLRRFWLQQKADREEVLL